jgi:sialate O-acetylesterase
MKMPLRLAAALAAFCYSIAVAYPDVSLPHVFSDHMVLQQGQIVPVWGMANPGEKITVTFGGETATSTTAPDGHWLVKLAPLKASAESRDLTVTGQNTVAFHDVLVGEVWLASGQSNMDFTVARTPKYYFAGVRDEAQEVKNANYPLIRMFSGIWAKSATPQSDIDGQWKVCTPENVREFSAAAYFYAKYLHLALKVPVGIITETFGASTAESWIRREALVSDPKLKPMVDALDTKLATFNTAMAALSPEAKQAREDARKASAAALAAAEAKDVADWKANPDVPTTGTVARGGGGARGANGPADPAQDQHNPTVMYNGMIAPIIPYAIQGVIWYQGESIAGGVQGGVALYPYVQATLIKDWRKLWGRDDMPFYIVQLAALGSSNSNSPETRAAQATVFDLPRTGMACSIDIADPTNVHPKDKQNVGYRLMRIALADTYGWKIEDYGPTYQSMEVKDGKAVLHFSHTTGGLVAKGGDLTWFEITGADGNFVKANAVIDKDTVVVSSPDVTAPTAVRYAWDKYPVGVNFYNGADLPAAPFRTDKK